MIRTVADTGSTNADLIAAAREGAPEGTWLRAEQQHGGRGRLGRAWMSPPGNLYASTIVRLRATDASPPGLALVAGVALEEAAGAYAPGAALRLKWPNDLMAEGAKLGGILLERADDAVVIGFGVNLAHAPSGLERPVTSMAALTGTAPEPAQLVVDLADALARWLDVWRARGMRAIVRRWLDRAHPRGTALAAITGEGRHEGLFEGLTDEGVLKLRLVDGSIATVQAGDVFLL